MNKRKREPEPLSDLTKNHLHLVNNNNETPMKKNKAQPQPHENSPDSFDRLPPQKSDSPPYKYQRDALRRKEDRMKLPGQTCQNCKAFYEAYDEQERKKMIEMCSRHRYKWNRSVTPPGIWKVTFSDTDDSE